MSEPVVLSYGMGVDSTAILLRWLTDESSRDFPLDQLTVITAMTGDEWPRTGQVVTDHVLPLMREHGVRYVQVARGGPTVADGVVTLSDTRQPTEVRLGGVYKLSQELTAAGTVPQVASGRRTCSIKQKGVPLDTWIGGELAGSNFRHVMGFNADEGKRAARDSSYSNEQRASEYPLIEWGWNRETCLTFIGAVTGVPDWPKSCCTYCPFAEDNHLARYADLPEAGAMAARIEHVARALNPRMTLFAKDSVVDLIEGQVPEAYDRFLSDIASAEHALYDVRRVWFARRDGSGKKGSSARSIRILARGSAVGMHKLCRTMAVAKGGEHPVTEDGVMRTWILRQGPTYPTAERFLVVAPADADEKERPSFPDWWRRLAA